MIIANPSRSWCALGAFQKGELSLLIFITYVSSLALGVLLLGWVILRAMKEQRSEDNRALTLPAKEVHAS